MFSVRLTFLLFIINLISVQSTVTTYVGDCLSSTKSTKTTDTYYVTLYTVTLSPGEYCTQKEQYNFLIGWTDDFAGTTVSQVEIT